MDIITLLFAGIPTIFAIVYIIAAFLYGILAALLNDKDSSK
jgi:demethoxyubiquinone hydroxylase (CLK1/Coq7/Cat5 family)